MKKKSFLIAASVVMILVGILRGLGGIVLLARGNNINTGHPVVASGARMRIVALGLLAVCLLLVFSAINVLRKPDKKSWNLCWTALIIFLTGGVINGYLLFGHPIDKGQLINLSAVIICIVLLYLGKPLPGDINQSI
jgi:hypothetical protein